jgi:hypothetical protein
MVWEIDFTFLYHLKSPCHSTCTWDALNFEQIHACSTRDCCKGLKRFSYLWSLRATHYNTLGLMAMIWLSILTSGIELESKERSWMVY